MSSTKVVSAILICLLTTACAKSRYLVPSYRPQETSIRSDLTPSPLPTKKYSVNTLATGNPAQATADCRLGVLISPSDGRSFADYVAEALIAELTKAWMYDRQSREVISVQAVRADVNTTKFGWDPRVAEAIWHIEADFSLQGRQSLAMTDYSFLLSHANGHIACSEATYAFPAATKEIVQKMVQTLAR
jgi:hypothetical protein